MNRFETITTEQAQCRICLEAAESMISMFEDSTIPYKLELCCGVQILNIATLPSQMCKKCSDILNVAYDFRVLCQRSQEYLSDQQFIGDDDESKPNLNEIDLEQFGDFDGNIVFVQVEEKFKKQTEGTPEVVDEEYTEVVHKKERQDAMQVEQSEEEADEKEYTQTDDEEKQDEQTEDVDEDDNHTDDKDYEPPLKKQRKQQGRYFQARAPKKPKPPVTFMCNICGNLYKNKATFNYHMKLHRNDKKYECEICSKRFMQTCELRAHIRVHTGEKPFNCSYCDRKFRDRSGVTRHERTHTNEKPYGCTICGTFFSYAATLNKHKKVHTGEKPFKCMICSKDFNESYKLKEHFGTIRHREMAAKSKLLILK